jgi:hypothetical protein
MTVLEVSKRIPFTRRSRQLWSAKLCRLRLILGFNRQVNENCTLQGYYAASRGNLLPTFRDSQPVPSSSDSWKWDWQAVPKRRQGAPENGTDMSRNGGNERPLIHYSLSNNPKERSSVQTFPLSHGHTPSVSWGKRWPSLWVCPLGITTVTAHKMSLCRIKQHAM